MIIRQANSAISGIMRPCDSCKRRLIAAGGLLRCNEWRRHPTLTRCSEYVGPHKELHYKLVHGPDYADSLAHAKK